MPRVTRRSPPLNSSSDRMNGTDLDLVFSDDFSGAALDAGRWIDHYLPPWSTPDRTAARYARDGTALRPLIDAAQPAWRLEDGPMRGSTIQTGSFSGALGACVGQHRHRPDLRVRSPQPTRRLWTPSAGL